MTIKNNKPEITGPEQIIDMASGYQKSRIILTAFELDIFSAIGAGFQSSEDISRKIGAKQKSTERFLNALCALGFLRKENGLFANTETSTRYLTKGSEDYLSRIGHMLNLYRSWGTLTEAVKAGASVTAREYDPQSLAHFIEAMHHRARKSANALIANINLNDVRRLLDVGGGSGVYSMAFVRANPQLEAVVFDLPNVTELTRKYISQAGLSERITTIEGDYNKDDFGKGYDVVFMSAIVHINSYDENVRLIQKAYNSLNAGGRIIIQDHIMENDRISPVRGALFAINMLVNTQGGDTYTETEMREWFSKAGFDEIKRIATGMENDLMIGIRRKSS
jgi:predicted O-methyltransferase YrrM